MTFLVLLINGTLIERFRIFFLRLWHSLWLIILDPHEPVIYLMRPFQDLIGKSFRQAVVRGFSCQDGFTDNQRLVSFQHHLQGGTAAVECRQVILRSHALIGQPMLFVEFLKDGLLLLHALMVRLQTFLSGLDDMLGILFLFRQAAARKNDGTRRIGQGPGQGFPIEVRIPVQAGFSQVFIKISGKKMLLQTGVQCQAFPQDGSHDDRSGNACCGKGRIGHPFLDVRQLLMQQVLLLLEQLLSLLDQPQGVVGTRGSRYPTLLIECLHDLVVHVMTGQEFPHSQAVVIRTVCILDTHQVAALFQILVVLLDQVFVLLFTGQHRLIHGFLQLFPVFFSRQQCLDVLAGIPSRLLGDR